MNNVLTLLLMAITGFAIGVFFFGTLWFTVQKAVTAKLPALWFIGSFIIRMAVTLSIFYFVTQGALQNLAACLIAFIAARVAVMRFTKGKTLHTAKETTT